MARPKEDSVTPRRRRPPATTAEGRERQMVSLATDLAEKQIRQGTASAQVITHYLKLATTREQLERDKLKQENELLKARVKSLASLENIEQMYSQALNAMRAYSGQDYAEDDDDY